MAEPRKEHTSSNIVKSMEQQLELDVMKGNEQFDDKELSIPPKEDDVDDGECSVNGEKEQKIAFNDSTHQYLLYISEEGHSSRDCVGWLFGVGAIALEYVLLSFMLNEGTQLLEDEQVPVTVRYGQSCHGIEYVRQNLNCSPDYTGFIDSLFAPALLTVFLLTDTCVAFKAIFTAKGILGKLGALAVVSITLFACHVGGLYAHQGQHVGSAYDAITNCVGVLFICDIDEKLYTVYLAVRDFVNPKMFEKWRICRSCVCNTNQRVIYAMLFCCILFLFMGASVPAMVNSRVERDADWLDTIDPPTTPSTTTPRPTESPFPTFADR